MNHADTLPMRRVLFLCNDVIGQNMAGSGIRYWELARSLSRHIGSDPAVQFQVTLAVLPFLPEPILTEALTGLHVRRCHTPADVRVMARETDVIVTQGVVLATYPFLTRLGKPLALDFGNPYLVERLHVDRDTTSNGHLLKNESYRGAQALQVRWADFVFCNSDKQRDYWLGVMSALGRVNPYTHADDPTLRRLIDVVPFGLPSESPHHTKQVLKGVHPGIGVDDKVLLWLSGIWNWFDAPTLIRAMSRISEQRPNVKLFFMGIKHPSPTSQQVEATAKTIALSQELGVYNHSVFFKDWVPYAERANYLLEADLGVNLQQDHLEARFAFRTRYLDYLWTGLPMVVTRGDVLSELVAAHDLGRVVEPGDVNGLAAAIQDLLDVPHLREDLQPRFEQVAALFRWEAVAQPLIKFCIAPRLAPDKEYLRSNPGLGIRPTSWWRLPGKAVRALRAGGMHGLARQVNEYRHWLLNR